MACNALQHDVPYQLILQPILLTFTPVNYQSRMCLSMSCTKILGTDIHADTVAAALRCQLVNARCSRLTHCKFSVILREEMLYCMTIGGESSGHKLAVSIAEHS